MRVRNFKHMKRARDFNHIVVFVLNLLIQNIQISSNLSQSRSRFMSTTSTPSLVRSFSEQEISRSLGEKPKNRFEFDLLPFEGCYKAQCNNDKYTT